MRWDVYFRSPFNRGALLLLVASTAGPRRSSFSKPSGRFVGVNVTGAAGTPGAGAALEDLRAVVTRMSVNWFEEVGGLHADSSNLEQLHKSTEAPGLEVLANLAYRYDAPGSVPGSAAFGSCDKRPAGRRACIPARTGEGGVPWNTFLSDWTALVNREIRFHLAPGTQRITYWSPWNEANASAFFHGDAAQYDALAGAMCNAIHTVNDSLDAVSSSTPRLTCVGPELAAITSGTGVQQTQRDWFKARLRATHFDVVAVHVYGEPAVLTTSVRQLLADKNSVAGYSTRPLWITEAAHVLPGVATGAHDPELQDKGVYTVLNTWNDSLRGVDGIFWFDLMSKDWGLMNGPSRKRPAYYGFRNWQNNNRVAPAANQCDGATGVTRCELLVPP